MLTVKTILRCMKMDEALGRNPFGGLCHDKNPTPPFRPRPPPPPKCESGFDVGKYANPMLDTPERPIEHKTPL
ncbi:MAG: hypothetical protein WC787_01695 [Patescibacteria group bacterium]